MEAPVMVVTVIRMTQNGAKTAVSSLTSHNFQSKSSGLEIQGHSAILMRRVTTL